MPSDSFPLILGHRGAPLSAPENTIAAFAEAMRQGAHGVEFDVQKTRDGVPVVMHDDSLERTTDGTGRLADLDWEQLASARARGEPIPSLREAVEWAGQSGAILNVEIKTPGVEEATLEALAAADLLADTIISSFDPAIVRSLGSLWPASRRYLLSESWHRDTASAMAAADAVGLCLRVDAASPLALRVLASRGTPVIVWTVDEPDRIRELLLAGVQGIITNTPGAAVTIARQIGMLGGGPSAPPDDL